MRADMFFVVGRESSVGTVKFKQTYMDGVMPAVHWGELRFADRYPVFEDARKETKNIPSKDEGYGPADVWRVEVTVIKEKT